jgi:hypothetical protein
MARTFAARLICPRCDATSWLTLSDREESFEEILHQEWDFKCREDGPQRGIPVELLEVAPLDDPAAPATEHGSQTVAIATAVSAPPKTVTRAGKRSAIHVPVVIYGFGPTSVTFKEETETVLVNAGGALVLLKANLSVGDTVFLLDKITGAEQEVRVAYIELYANRESRVGLAFKDPLPDFWRRARKQPRISKSLRVVVKGKDPEGRAFTQSAFTVDLSQEGARLDGVGVLTARGQTIEVRRLWRKANYRVVWVGQIGTAESNQVGLFALESGKNIWNVKLPQAHGPESADPASRKK